MSVPGIEKVMNIASSRNLTEATIALFMGYEFRPADAGLAVSALKFLNVVDDNGKPTSDMEKLRLKGDAGKQAFEKILRTAYKKLFDAVDNPHQLPSDELHNEMVVQYKLTPRVARTAVPVFLKLCEYAGLKEEGSITSKKRQPKTEKSGKKAVLPGAPARSAKELHDIAVTAGFSPIRVAEGRMVLNVPSKLKDKLLDDDKVSADWSVLRKALREFADKYIPENENGSS